MKKYIQPNTLVVKLANAGVVCSSPAVSFGDNSVDADAIEQSSYRSNLWGNSDEE